MLDTTSPYQNQGSFATYCTGNGGPTPRWVLGILLAWTLLTLGLPTAPTQAAPPIQAGSEPTHVFLLPHQADTVQLLTHTADLALAVDESSNVSLQVTARYRLHNTDTQPQDVLLRLDAGVDPPTLPADLQAIDEARGTPLPITVADGVPQLALRLAADERLTLALRYTLALPNPDLVTVDYPMAALRAWPTQPTSWRVSIHLPHSPADAFPEESWLQLSPEGWRRDGRQIYWLSEAAIPPTPFHFQAIHPRLWAEMTQLRAVLRAEPSLDAARRLADHYRRLYAHPQVAPADRERFYAQALATYSQALDLTRSLGLDGTLQAELHHARAGLYRSRAITPDGQVDPTYLDLLRAEVEAALAALPPGGSPLRAELSRWQAEALRLQLDQAQRRQEWTTALALLEQLESLPPGLVDPEWLAAARQQAVLQQALLLLERGDLEGALALAGPEITAQDLVPLDARTLFTPWQASWEIIPNRVHLRLESTILPGRSQEAARALEQLEQAWQAVATPNPVTLAQEGDTVRLELVTEQARERLDLAQATPRSPHWALLRALLAQSVPEVTRTSRAIWQRTEMRLAVDLRPVADQWLALAQRLRQEAAQADAAAQITADPGERLRLRLQALYREQEADHWQRLAQESQIRVHLASQAGGPSRTWALRPGEGPRTLVHHSEQVDRLRLALLFLGILAVIAVLATVLWLLL